MSLAVQHEQYLYNIPLDDRKTKLLYSLLVDDHPIPVVTNRIEGDPSLYGTVHATCTGRSLRQTTKNKVI